MTREEGLDPQKKPLENFRKATEKPVVRSLLFTLSSTNSDAHTMNPPLKYDQSSFLVSKDRTQHPAFSHLDNSTLAYSGTEIY